MAWLSRLRRRIKASLRRPKDGRQASPTSGDKERNEQSTPHHFHHTAPVVAPSPATSSSALVTPKHGHVNFYPNAGNISIGQQNITSMQSIGSSKTVFEYLDPHVSHGAAHDSDERCDAPTCAPETREAIQGEIVGLIRDGDKLQPSKKIIWLGGPAGCGKTAVVGSVAETCKSCGLLAASFFFSSYLGSANRRSKQYLIPTLAYQLALLDSLHEYKAQLSIAIERNPSIFRKRILEQAECLILGPLRAIQGICDTSNWPPGIILDGLDEVKAVQHHETEREELQRTDEGDQLEILQVLLVLATDPSFPFRIFIASRPERVIKEFFGDAPQDSTITLFLDSKYNPDADIRRFLQSKFADIRRRFGISDILWPGKKDIDQLVEMSSGQFIVPSTIVRYVGSGLPQKQLDDILQVARAKDGAKNPFALLDALYAHVIARSPNPRVAVMWIQCFQNVENLVGNPLASHFWRKFFEEIEGEFNYILTPLASLLSVPHHEDRVLPVTIYHKSLTDYLTSEVRSGVQYVSEGDWHSFASERIVRILKNKGPKVPFVSTDDLLKFRSELMLLRSLTHPPSRSFVRHHYYWLCRPRPFVDYLREESFAELADCDVASWVRPFLTIPESQPEDHDPPRGIAWFDSLYHTIHAKSCGSETFSPDCHPACTRWRQGFLDEARALGWCIHEWPGPQEEPGPRSKRFFQCTVRRLGKQLDGSIWQCNTCQPTALNDKEATS
ncbi:hypothetical protein NMY22_g12141 [Coprinellus aureogranulatus]|nr:hypothetical protein NMY22_g12141 [Coprinellus aureogranulatus]